MLDAILESLSVLKPLLGDSGLLFSIAIGVTFAVLSLCLLYLVGAAVNPVRRRLQSPGESAYQAPSMAKKIDRSVAPIKGLIVPKNKKELGAAAKKMLYAGFRGHESVTAYYAIKISLMIGLGVIGGLLAYIFGDGSSAVVMLAIIAGTATGMILPSYYVDKRIAKRQREIVNGFPDVLDLIVACSEAGLGLNAALQRVSRETTTMYPVLSEELELVNSEILAGVDRVDALHNLSSRNGVDELSGFVSMISQSVRFGTSIADTLRIYAEEFRDKRMQKAEEQAAKVGTKLIFPLVLCIFPSFFIVAIGPAVISIIRVFEQMR